MLASQTVVSANGSGGRSTWRHSARTTGVSRTAVVSRDSTIVATEASTISAPHSTSVRPPLSRAARCAAASKTPASVGEFGHDRHGDQEREDGGEVADRHGGAPEAVRQCHRRSLGGGSGVRVRVGVHEMSKSPILCRTSRHAGSIGAVRIGETSSARTSDTGRWPWLGVQRHQQRRLRAARRLRRRPRPGRSRRQQAARAPADQDQRGQEDAAAKSRRPAKAAAKKAARPRARPAGRRHHQEAAPPREHGQEDLREDRQGG